MFIIFDSGRIRSYTLKEFREAQPLGATAKTASAELPREGYNIEEPASFARKPERRFSRQYREISKTLDQEEITPLMPAERIMSHPVVYLQQTNTLNDVIRMMANNRFRHIPIVDDNYQLMGIISDRQVFKALFSDEHTFNGTDLAAEHMVKKVVSARPKTSVLEIAYVMFELNVGSMPIVADDGHILGIVTRSDIGRAFLMTAHLDISL